MSTAMPQMAVTEVSRGGELAAGCCPCSCPSCRRSSGTRESASRNTSPVMSSTSSESMALSVTTVPSAFGKRNAVPSLQYGTSGKFTRSGDDETQGITEEYGVDAYAAARLFANGLQRLLPSPSSEELCRDTEGERQQHPGPAHLVEQYLLHLLEIESAIHPIEDGTAQKRAREPPSKYCLLSFSLSIIAAKVTLLSLIWHYFRIFLA